MSLCKTPVQMNMEKLKKYQIQERKEREAIETIDHYYAGYPSDKSGVREKSKNILIKNTLRKLGYAPKDLGLSL